LNINAQTPKEPESAMYQSLNGTNVPMSPADNHRIGSSQSAPHLSKTASNTKNLIQSREGTAGITAGAATTTMISTATTNGGVNRINNKTNEKTKRNNVASLFSQTSAEWQVDKLTKEVTSLAIQLDESLREKEQQRLEILRLRKHFMSVSNNRVANSTSMVILPHNLQLPSILSNTTSHDSLNINNNNNNNNGSNNGNGNVWRDTGGRHITNADLHGVPSTSDKQDLRLIPTDPSVKTISSSLASTSGELAAKKKVSC